MIPRRVQYLRPGTCDDALAALADPDAKVLAGGHSLIPMMKLRVARPSLLVDIGGLGFQGSTTDGTVVSIGALTTYNELVALDGALPDAVRESAAAVGDMQVRNMGTIGGALAHGFPASDTAAAMVALDATLRLRSPEGVRDCAADEFFRGPMMTVLEQQELLVEIAFAALVAGEASAYQCVEEPASGYPLAGAAVKVLADGERVAACSVGLTGATPTPCRVPAVEQALIECGPDLDVVREALTDLQLIPIDGGTEYRRQLAAVVITRAFEQARTRASRGAAG